MAEAIRADAASVPRVSVGELVSGNDRSQPFEIPIHFDGIRRLQLQFFDDLPNVEWHQVLDAINQLQDLVVEDTRQPWPLCEIHGDVLVPTEYPDGSIWWVCDRGSGIAIPLGNLNRT